MYYSGGEQYEPNAIGYATSPDGLQWTKHPNNPIFRPEARNRWEQDRVTACQVIRRGQWHIMFYIGFQDENYAQIGLARSRDGLTNWERHPANPIIRARTERREAWDFDACYKPFAILEQGRWLLWYNGRKGNVEQIGLAIHEGADLWAAAAAADAQAPAGAPPSAGLVLRPEALLQDYPENAGWLARNVPLLDCPDEQFSVAWKQLTDPQGFYAPYGPTTAERRHSRFMFKHGHECLWNGPSWPYATAVTLTALANLLNINPQDFLTKRDYFELLRSYARSQRLRLPNGSVVPWIDENLHPDTGEWLARAILEQRGVKDRGKDYNHSTFADLVITGLAGLRPRADEVIEVNPLIPAGAWDWFCLDRVRYHGRWLTIVWDKTGAKYGRGAGLRVFADGQELAAVPTLQRLLCR
jgi:hypothetical protein